MYLDRLLVLPNDSHSNYVNLPVDILDTISKHKNINTPYLFELKTSYGLSFYVGVNQFTAQEKTIEVPFWILENLGEDYVELCTLDDVPIGKYVKLEPLEEHFFGLPENDIILEKALSKYCILQSNQIITVKLLDEVYRIKILEIKDTEDIQVEYANILNIDINVDFKNKFLVPKPPAKKINIIEKEMNTSQMIPDIKEEKQEGKRIGGVDTNTDNVRKARLDYYEKLFQNNKK